MRIPNSASHDSASSDAWCGAIYFQFHVFSSQAHDLRDGTMYINIIYYAVGENTHIHKSLSFATGAGC